jgi:hypothetical protein
VNDLQQYPVQIVEPTFADYAENPHSMRHAYLACVAVYHSIDRASYPRKPGTLRKEWGKKSIEFAVVDMVAHKLKHIISGDEKRPPKPGTIKLSQLIFGQGTLNTKMLNSGTLGDDGIDLHNLYFVIRDAIKFVHEEALKLPGATP